MDYKYLSADDQIAAYEAAGRNAEARHLQISTQLAAERAVDPATDDERTARDARVAHYERELAQQEAVRKHADESITALKKNKK